MTDLTIDCPHCGVPIELTEALAGPTLEAERRKAVAIAELKFATDRKAIEEAAVATARTKDATTIATLLHDARLKEGELTKAKEAELAAIKAKQEAEEAKRNVDLEVARRVSAETELVTKRARDETAQIYGARLEAAESALAETDLKRRAAEEAELAAIKAKQEAEEAKRNVDLEVARRVSSETEVAMSRVRDEAAQLYGAKLQAAELALAATDAKRRVAEEAEMAALKAKADAEEAQRQAGLTIARRLDEERGKVREQALKERDDEYRLKMSEKERQLSELKVKLDEVQRKADQGSQQLKGEVLELDLYDALLDAFPEDEIERIKKGQKGGDIIHSVRSSSGFVCGRIKWESKRTQTWTDTWLPKLREDQRAHKCDLAALMTETLPGGVTHFDVIDDVWVSGIATVLPMAAALRRGLIDTATARRAAAGADSKKDIVYTYLTGPEFRARVRGIVEPVVEMRTTLDAEKRSASRQFALREKQLERMGLSLSGMYGDLQGLVGPSLPTVEGLALPEPEAEESGEALQLTADAPASASGEVH